MRQKHHTELSVERGLISLGCWPDEKGEWQEPPPGDGAYLNGPMRSPKQDAIERASRYVEKMPPAIAGSSGHDTTFHVAQILLRGFALSAGDAWPIMRDYNARCQPQWSEAELRHKMDSAEKNSKLPWGFILMRGEQQQQTTRKPWHPGNQKREDIEPSIFEETEVRDFPLHVLPDPLGHYCRELAESIGCPPDFAAVTMLVVAGAAIGATRSVHMKAGWLSCPRIYAGIVADPGAAKTPAIGAICRPLWKLQAKKAAEFTQAMDQYESDKKTYDYASRNAEKNGAKCSVPNPEKPTYPHIVTTDATTEGIAVMLDESPRGLIMVKDEIAAWVSSMNQYKGGKGADRQFWLSAWSGESAKVDRKNSDRGPILIPHPFVSVLGGIQPDMLSVLCDEKNREDGFIHRILFSYPVKVWGHGWTDVEPSQHCELAWSNVVAWLLSLDMVEDESGKHPRVVFLSPEAKEIMKQWMICHASEEHEPEFPYEFNGPWKKMKDYFGRLALVVHYLRLACNDTTDEMIDQKSAEAAAWLCEYFKSHLAKVYGKLKMSGRDKIIEQIVGWMKLNGGEISGRDLVRAHFAKKSSEVDAIMKELEDRGYGSMVELPCPGGRKRTVFRMDS